MELPENVLDDDCIMLDDDDVVAPPPSQQLQQQGQRQELSVSDCEKELLIAAAEWIRLISLVVP